MMKNGIFTKISTTSILIFDDYSGNFVFRVLKIVLSVVTYRYVIYINDKILEPLREFQQNI